MLLPKILTILSRRPRLYAAGAVSLVVLLMVAASGDQQSHDGRTATTTVQRGPLTISLEASGSVRPRQQVILRNEMDDPAAIVSIVPEGTLVEAGDLLVELNATEAETELVERRIRVQNGEAELVYARENLSVVKNQAEADIDQAELNLQFARQDLEKYLEGDHLMELLSLESKINLAEEELKQANEKLRWSRILAEEKYLSDSELERDELSARKVELNLDLARRDLSVYNRYTHPRQLAEFEAAVRQSDMALERAVRKAAANVAQAEAELRAREASLEEEYARLRRAEREIERSRIYAPISGMAIYASSVSNRVDEDRRIQEGAIVNKRAEIIYLPTANLYDVDIQIPEADLNKVEVGQPVRITSEAMPGRVFSGRIGSVARLPDSRSRYLNPNLKLYNVVVELDRVDMQLRNGMTCRAEIMIEHHEDALFVPLQAVARHRGRPAVHAVEVGGSRPVEVELGLDNSRVVRIVDGIREGQRILLAPPFDHAPPTPEERWATEPQEDMEKPAFPPVRDADALAGVVPDLPEGA